MKFWFNVLAFLLLYNLGFAQILSYHFDQCEINSIGQVAVDATLVGNPDCVCGIGDNSFSLDGINDGIVVSDTFNKYLGEEFTVDFYFHLNNSTDIVDIFSMRHNCTADSFITLKYLQSSNALLFEMSIDNGVYYSINQELSDYCWHRVTITRSKLNYSLYVDNVLSGTINAIEQVALGNQATISFSNSPCLSPFLSRMEGNIDEVNIYDRSFSQAEIIQSYLFPGRLISKDTTVFAGNEVQLQFGNSCSNSIIWSPSNNLDDASVLNPISTPDETTTYKVMSSEFGCPEEDEVTIYVINKDSIDCSELLLPTAFTPNGDNLNDQYGISNLFVLEELVNMEILDRWGNIVFVTKDPYRTWDGTFGNTPCDPGVYYVRVSYKCNGNNQNYNSNFVLIR